MLNRFSLLSDLATSSSCKRRVIGIILAIAFLSAARLFVAFALERLNRLSAELGAVRSDLDGTRKQLAETLRPNEARYDALKVKAAQQEQQSAQLNAAQSAINGLSTEMVQLTNGMKRNISKLEEQIHESADLAIFLHPIDMTDSKVSL